MRRSILRDTILLTLVQMALDGLSLLVNVLICRRIGTSAVGVMSLAGSFFRLACVIAGGNAFLCVSRFVSEELGKRERDPGAVLRLCVLVSLTLSGIIMALICGFAKPLAAGFLHDAALIPSIRRMALALPLMTLASCCKGWCNALCKAGLCAAADGVEFALRSGVMLLFALTVRNADTATLCDMTAISAAAGAGGELVFLAIFRKDLRAGKTGRVSLTLRDYLRLSIPVMAGSALTSLLSAANDALVPVTLRQAGNSAQEALSQFGIFEAMILPTLFFPSTILCSLAGILVTETAREHAADRKERIRSLTSRTVCRTIDYAGFVTLILLTFGDEIGEMLGGGEIAGRMIRLLAPVVPFIYLEIVLEAVIKGLGAQAFSSLNYLCEYIIRITIVLVCIPLFGFYGIVLSYYASNIIGNIARIIVVFRRAELRIPLLRLIGVPAFAAVLASQGSRAVFLLLHADPGCDLWTMLLFTLLCGAGFAGTLRLLGKERPPMQRTSEVRELI